MNPQGMDGGTADPERIQLPVNPNVASTVPPLPD